MNKLFHPRQKKKVRTKTKSPFRNQELDYTGLNQSCAGNIRHGSKPSPHSRVVNLWLITVLHKNQILDYSQI
jgi:hypothetical protein